MKVTITLFTCLFSAAMLWGQSDLDIQIKNWSKDGNFDAIIAQKDKASSMSDSSLYRLGRSYFFKDDTANCRKYLHQTLQKNPKFGNAWYYIGASYHVNEEYEKALYAANQGLIVQPKDPDFWVMKAELFEAMMLPDSALVYYLQATKLDGAPAGAWNSAAIIYFEKKEYPKAIALFKAVQPLMDEKDSLKQSEYYFNWGLCHFLNNEAKESERLFLKANSFDPNDYSIISKIIQSLYKQKKYAAAEPWRAKMYQGWKDGKMPENLEEGFIFDQFKWKKRQIFVEERYEEPEDKLYYKHVFLVFSEDGEKVEFTVQTEHSEAISMIKKKYTLGKTTKRKHYTFIQFLYPEKFDYDELKADVIKILEEKENPSSSSEVTREKD
jgi:tetratricopeptide (TPR) repeat protein